MKTRPCILFTLCFILLLPMYSGERTIPVDVFLMIDKSLSMAESGKFDSMDQWVQTHLIDQILIDGDWVTIYQFYGTTDHLLSLTVETVADRSRITRTIGDIKPDGQYTDIGLALDTIKLALDRRGTNGRHKILLLLTDLKQEAPWTSRYAGSPDSFDSPYLAEARIIPHDAWYEITLDMDIQDRVVKTSRELFFTIEETTGTEKDLSGNENLTPGGPAGTKSVSGTEPGDARENTADTGAETDGAGASLPLPALIVIVFAIISACLAAVLVILDNRKKKKEQTE